MIVGMDFGTTNSGMAVYDGRSVNTLPLDPASPNPRVARTALYITNDQNITIGREAINQYFTQNIGRAVKMQKVWIGELEVYGADMFFITDVYAWVDVLSPGRLFLSVKTNLRNEEYAGTVAGQFYYSLENLVALYLSVTKTRAEKLLGRELRQIVLGRPVHFAHDPLHDQLAQSRLLQAACRAGYEKVYFQYEPIAAAFSYETSMTQEQNVLVFDFGGGTLDITIIRLGGGANRRKVLATGGIPIAGDVFDQKLVRAKLPKHFGEGSTYGPRHKQLTIPAWVYDAFSDWQNILELQSAENKKILQEIAQTARYKHQIESLVSLVSGNYGLKMFDIVELAKRTLSSKRGAEILLDGPGFHVREFVTRGEFEGIIRAEIRAIEDRLDETVRESGLTADHIDVVIRTGGSSQIPAFDEMLKRKFGADKVREVDVFSSVTAGLGIIAHGIETGELELEAHLPQETEPPAAAKQTRPNINPINLDLLQRRIQLVEGGSVTSENPQQTVVFLAENQVISRDRQQTTKIEPMIQAVTAVPAETLLLLTSQYRFLLITPRQLADLESLDMGLANLYQLGGIERFGCLGHWSTITHNQRLLIVTSTGFVRPFPMDVFRANIEAPVPLKLDNPLPGVPVAVLGLNPGDELLLFTRQGRAVRVAGSQLKLGGVQVVNCGQDRVMGGVLTPQTAVSHNPFLAVTADGYGRLLLPAWVPLAEKANQKGVSLVARRSEMVGLLPAQGEIWAATTSRCVRLEYGRLPLEDSSKTDKVVKLETAESIQTIFA